jgi:hypothetical protein
LDFNGMTAPSDTCSLDDFIVPLTNVKCSGLTPLDDDMASAEACADYCCAEGTGVCEAWQYTDDLAQGGGHTCFLGRITADSCVDGADAIGWQGGARPSKNQLFTLVGDAVKSSQFINVTDASDLQEICLHARTKAPLPVDIPKSTRLTLESCSARPGWNQQFVFSNGTNGSNANMTISLLSDPRTCVDGVGRGPNGSSMLSPHMWTCWDDPSVGNSMAAAQEHQMWDYNASTKQLRLSNASKMSCDGVQTGIGFIGGDLKNPDGSLKKVFIASIDDCCDACFYDPDCKFWSYDTDPDAGGIGAHWCYLKKAMSPSPSPECPDCRWSKVQNRVSGNCSRVAATVDACLGMGQDLYDPSKILLYRQPCDVVGRAFTRSYQQWEFRGGSTPDDPPYIFNIRGYKCLTMVYETTDWSRDGAPQVDEDQALITAAHQPDTCLACISSSGKVSMACEVGDVPQVTRCNGKIDASRLTWSYKVAHGRSRTAAGEIASARHGMMRESNSTLAFLAAMARSSPPATSTGAASAGPCIRGLNMRFFDMSIVVNGTRPDTGGPRYATNPSHNMTADKCRKLCDLNAPGCKAYVFLKKHCEATSKLPLGHKYNDCYLKLSDQGNEVSEDCSCMGTVSPPAPMCATTTLPSAGEGRDMLPPGQSCSTQDKSTCCLKYDSGDDPQYNGQPCMPAKSGTFTQNTDDPSAVCMPLGWVVAEAPNVYGSCKDSGNMAFPCRNLVDKHSGLCLTAGMWLQFDKRPLAYPTSPYSHPFCAYSGRILPRSACLDAGVRPELGDAELGT